MQQAAGGVLGGVKVKQVEVQGLQQLAGALGELRALRRDASRRRGERGPPWFKHTQHVFCTSAV